MSAKLCPTSKQFDSEWSAMDEFESKSRKLPPVTENPVLADTSRKGI